MAEEFRGYGQEIIIGMRDEQAFQRVQRTAGQCLPAY